MKFQSVIFLTLLGLMALLSSAEAGPVNQKQVRALIVKQAGCILRGRKCDIVGETLKKVLPNMLKGCTINGCTGRSEEFRGLINSVRKNYPKVWNAVIKKYAHQ